MRRFEFIGSTSEKFWEITQAGTQVTVRFGRLGGNGQTQTKDLGSDKAAAAHAAKLIEEKVAKGYIEVSGDETESSAVVPTAGPADLVEKLRRAAPVVGPHLARGLLPAVRFAIRMADDSELRVGSTKLGGDPDLPAGTVWPAWRGPTGGSTDRPMRFFAQVEMSDVATAAPADLALPKSGLLSFFADFGEQGGIIGLYSDEQAGCCVLYTPPDTRLERRRSPVSTLPIAALLAVGAWTWPSDPPAGMELPDDEYDAFDELDTDYDHALSGLVPAGWTLSGRHQVGGHARYIQHPVEEEVVQAVGGCWVRGRSFDLKRWDAVKGQVTDWRVVLQIDSDNDLGLMWGDVGTIYWAARRSDIARGEWSGAMFNFQCS